MDVVKKNFSILFLVLFSVCIYTPMFGVLDKNSIQFLNLSIFNLLFLGVIPLIYSKLNIKKTLLSPLIICYAGYLIFSLLSMLKSINVVESLVKFNQQLTFFIALIIIVLLVSKKQIKTNHVLWVMSITLLIDVAFSLKAYFEIIYNNIDYSYNYVNRLLGLAGNRNILATSILFRIPFVIILAIRMRNIKVYIFSFILITISLFNIFLLSSRATFLSLILSVLIVLALSLIFRTNNINYFKKNIAFIFLLLIPMIISYQLSLSAISSDDAADVSNRIGSITSANDESKNSRIRYFTHAIESILDNPILGVGIGNWRIYSIKYDFANIENFIVPYSAHNDILEATAETGIVGGLMFSGFFLVMLIYIIKFIRLKSAYEKYYNYILFIFMPYITYMIDLNLNFPSSRPLNLYLLLLFITILLIENQKINEKQ